MKRWIAVLALVPAVAWGDCRSGEAMERFYRVAEGIVDAKRRGVAERTVRQEMMARYQGLDRRVFVSGVRTAYRFDDDVSAGHVAESMQAECVIATR